MMNYILVKIIKIVISKLSQTPSQTNERRKLDQHQHLENDNAYMSSLITPH